MIKMFSMLFWGLLSSPLFATCSATSLWPWRGDDINFQRRASSLFSICLSIYPSIRSAESSCRMDGVYLRRHTGSWITPALLRQTAPRWRTPPRIQSTGTQDEPGLMSGLITAAISPAIIKLHGAVRQIDINERSGALDLAKLSVSAATLASESDAWHEHELFDRWWRLKPLQRGKDTRNLRPGLI